MIPSNPDWPDIIYAKEGFPICNADLGYNLGIGACLIAFTEWQAKQPKRLSVDYQVIKQLLHKRFNDKEVTNWDAVADFLKLQESEWTR